ncbi:hypothetical protein PAXRUDRAFT_12109 [Paxillus rubicundulus Ve08.2h10]|uniref:Uncharacterized protein n=1 Tax=Paxillus rubicundulus Ve08.2h10 TaxID=930991 RepID=A0A0D0E1Q7_9AGAM|nr:hypothetical protein PAXRUDRAFT_12109 [Paxillus rubicundulus Ve08.2h10]
MSFITKIAPLETATAIWKFNPTLPINHVLNNSFDVVSVIQTLTIKIQRSCQHIEYLQALQANCSIQLALAIPLQSNIRWGMAQGMFSLSYKLRQAINLFLASADELYGPITTLRWNG